MENGAILQKIIILSATLAKREQVLKINDSARWLHVVEIDVKMCLN